MFSRYHAIAVTAILLVAGTASAADEPGSRDHPLVGRYQGSGIVFYKAADFDEAALLRAPHDYTDLLDRNATDDRSGPEWLQLEGRVTKIRYEIPPGRSSLEVIRNYEVALAQKGFDVMFRCADRACLTGKLRDPYLLGVQLDNGDSTSYFDHARYVLMRRSGENVPTFVAILAGENKQNATALVSVVEPGPIELDKIEFLDASAMDQAISQGGTVNLYGIRFDFDKDALRPESQPTLAELAKLLSQKPGSRLAIVGHTDDLGAADYNLDLSRRRAGNVAATLTQQYGIDGSRLSSAGAGLTSPIVPNTTNQNRSINRRVEIIAK